MTLEGYRKSDLINLTGASASQIERWVYLKLIPNAVRAGVYSRYPVETLARIRAVQTGYEGNVTWRDIRDRQNPPDDDEEASFEYQDDGALG